MKTCTLRWSEGPNKEDISLINTRVVVGTTHGTKEADVAYGVTYAVQASIECNDAINDAIFAQHLRKMYLKIESAPLLQLTPSS